MQCNTWGEPGRVSIGRPDFRAYRATFIVDAVVAVDATVAFEPSVTIGFTISVRAAGYNS